jgi:integrase
MALTDSALRAAKPADKQFKLSDSGGLYVIVKPSGGKLWRLKYRVHGKEKMLAIGVYPDISLKDARDRRDQAKKLLAQGKDPSAEKKRAAVAAKVGAANTFKAIAAELVARAEAEEQSDATLTKARWFLRLLEPALGARPVSEIEPYEILAVVNKHADRGRHETARRLLAFTSRVFRHAVATTRASRNPAADLKGALVAPKVKHHAAITEPAGVGALLRAIEGFEGQPSTKLALRLAPHVFVRPGELRNAEWPEIDLDLAIWRIPGVKMKMRQDHVVPLSRQSVAILRDAQRLCGGGKYVFPGVRSPRRPMSENTLNAALRRLGYSSEEMTSHGFRSTASTLLNESGRWSPDAIERALAHNDEDDVRAAYNRSVYWHERVEMAQWWSDYLETLRDGATIIPLKYPGAA